MSSQRQERKDRQNAHSDPINFMCGQCKKVFPFVEGYVCPECDYCKIEEVVEREPIE